MWSVRMFGATDYIVFEIEYTGGAAAQLLHIENLLTISDLDTR